MASSKGLKPSDIYSNSLITSNTLTINNYEM